MAERTPQPSEGVDGTHETRLRTGRPRWVTAVLVAALLLVALVLVLHPTGSGLGGLGSHLP